MLESQIAVMNAGERGLHDGVRSRAIRMQCKCEFTTILGVRQEAIVSLHQASSKFSQFSV